MNESISHIVAATGLVFRGDQILLVKSPARGWELPGGQIYQGESLLHGLKREILEESGIQVEVRRLKAVHQNLSRGIAIFAFICDFSAGELRLSAESTDVGWFSSGEARSMISRETMRVRFSDLSIDAPGIRYRAYLTSPFTQIEESEF